MRTVPSLTVLGLLVASAVGAATIVPPPDLGALGRDADAVVLARAGGSTGELGGPLPRTATRFERLELVGGDDPGAAFVVTVPGGEVGGVGALVPGAPRFSEGGVYLLFLTRSDGGRWSTALLAYGVLESVERSGRALLRPLGEAAEVRPLDLYPYEAPGVYPRAELLEHLRRVIAGAERWHGPELALAPSSVDGLGARTASEACQYMAAGSTRIRWFEFDGGGSVRVRATTPGQVGVADGGVGAVERAARAWSDDVGSAIRVVPGAPTAAAIVCGGGEESQPGAVVFNDPCGDIDPLHGCSGVLAYGGPYYQARARSFNGETFYPASDLFVVVNDGVGECLSGSWFDEVITHELGHGLGFGHHGDPASTMYGSCCRGWGASLGATDSACAAQLYPDGASVVPPDAPGAPRVVATAADRVQLAWGDVGGESGYRVERTQGGATSLVASLGANATGFTDTGLTPCTSFAYTVAAFNAYGEGRSAATTARTDGSAPAAPTGLRAAVGEGRVELAWNAVSGAAWLSVQRAPAGGAYTEVVRVDGRAVAWSDPAPLAGTVSSYRVAAGNSCGAGAASAAVQVTVPGGGLLLAGAARLAGVGDSFWRTSLVATNPTGVTLQGDLVLRREDGGTTAVSRYHIAPYRQLVLQDLLGSLGREGKGVVELRPDGGGTLPLLAARTFTDGAAGSFGQAVPAATAAAGAVHLTGLTGRPEARVNIGVAAGASSPLRGTLRLERPGRSSLERALPEVRAGGLGQWSLESLFGAGVLEEVEVASLTLELADAGVAYASVVDEGTDDPTFIAARPAATRWLVPVLGRGPGEAGTWWDSELALYNPGSGSVRVVLEHLAADRDNRGGGPRAEVVLEPRETRRLTRVQERLFGVGSGLGSLQITAPAPVAAAVRISTPWAAGSMGQGIAPLGEGAALAAVIPWARQDQRQRTNIGLVNRGSLARSIELRLWRDDGSVRGVRTVQVPPRSLVQRSLRELFGDAALGEGRSGWLEVRGGGGEVAAYASIVDQSSGDPVYVTSAR